MNHKSRQAFVKRFGPMKAEGSFCAYIEEYNRERREWWKIWEAAREWQRKNPKEK